MKGWRWRVEERNEADTCERGENTKKVCPRAVNLGSGHLGHAGDTRPTLSLALGPLHLVSYTPCGIGAEENTGDHMQGRCCNGEKKKTRLFLVCSWLWNHRVGEPLFFKGLARCTLSSSPVVFFSLFSSVQ